MTDFKIKMAELAKKYNISHKRDIDWHNFVAEVEQLTEAKEQKPKIVRYGVMRKMEAVLPVDWYMDENGKEHCWGYKFNYPCPWPAEVYIMEAKEDKR